jgi:hypothetical protein
MERKSPAKDGYKLSVVRNTKRQAAQSAAMWKDDGYKVKTRKQMGVEVWIKKNKK